MEQQDELIASIKKLTFSLELLVKEDKISQCEELLLERQKCLEQLVAQIDKSSPDSNSTIDTIRSLLTWVQEQDSPIVEEISHQKVNMQQKLLKNNRASHAINKYRDNL